MTGFMGQGKFKTGRPQAGRRSLVLLSKAAGDVTIQQSSVYSSCFALHLLSGVSGEIQGPQSEQFISSMS